VSYLVGLADEDQLEKVRDYSADYLSLTPRGKAGKSKTMDKNAI
jgi:hypothetical protein